MTLSVLRMLPKATQRFQVQECFCLKREQRRKLCARLHSDRRCLHTGPRSFPLQPPEPSPGTRQRAGSAGRGQWSQFPSVNLAGEEGKKGKRRGGGGSPYLRKTPTAPPSPLPRPPAGRGALPGGRRRRGTDLARLQSAPPGRSPAPRPREPPRRPARPAPASERRRTRTGPGGGSQRRAAALRARGRSASRRVTHILATAAAGEDRRTSAAGPET